MKIYINSQIHGSFPFLILLKTRRPLGVNSGYLGLCMGPHYSTERERNGTESVVALFYGTERNTANMVNFHKSNLML